MKVLNIGQAVRYGFKTFLSHIGFLIGYGCIAGILYYVSAILLIYTLYMQGVECIGLGVQAAIISLVKYISASDTINPIVVLILIGQIIIGCIVSIWCIFAFTNVSLRIRDTGSVSLKDFYSFIPELPALFLISCIVGFITCCGLMAFIIPGIYWLARSCFSLFVLLDEEMDSWPSIKKSLAITKGHEWQLIGLGCVIFIIVLIPVQASVKLMQLCEPLTDNSVYCLIPTTLMVLIVVWMVEPLVSLIAVDAYRQLNPKR